ncbi:MAG TPA: methyltransferase domain-containing protein [Pyrinomonadaceae bacterium]|nr:methyltransferase domain-containing protein [Pyrinomonadaceae bacterium]
MNLEEIRQFFAEEIAEVANIQTERLVAAFARVPREHFLGPGPWKIANPDALQTPAGHAKSVNYRNTIDDDPRRLYHNIVVAIDPEKQLNNGQPGSLATWLDALELQEGDEAVHIGCGVGYYTAIMAETVGPSGHVVGVEVEAHLAKRANENLSYLGNAEAVYADGGKYDPAPLDALFVNAGATFPRAAWLDCLRPGGRLVFPLTITQDNNFHSMGFMVKIKRQANGYSARFLSSVMIFPCLGARSDESNQRLREALMKGTWGTVQSLRRDKHDADDTCWLHGEDFCLSVSAVQSESNT